MVRRRPRTEEEFAEINGVGAAKLEAFAEPFLAAIDEALTEWNTLVPEGDGIGEANGFSTPVAESDGFGQGEMRDAGRAG